MKFVAVDQTVICPVSYTLLLCILTTANEDTRFIGFAKKFDQNLHIALNNYSNIYRNSEKKSIRKIDMFISNEVVL